MPQVKRSARSAPDSTEAPLRTSCMLSLRLFAVGLLVLAAAAPASAQDPTVRVRLLGGPVSAPEITAEGGPARITDAAGAVTVLPDRDDATARARRGQVTIMGMASSRFEIEGTHLRIQRGRTDRLYSGRLVLTAVDGKVQIVNHVPLPPYLASVTASEYPFTEIEGVKAQAVLARTYALRRQGAKPDYDLDDHQGSQVYKGMEVVTDVTREAVELTRGVVLTYRGELAEAFYSSSSGGFTAANESVWTSGAPIPYLRAVADPYDAQAPDHRWTKRLSASAVHAALSRRYGGTVSGFDVVQRGPSGRAVQVRLHGASRSTISGSQFRSAVNAGMGWRTILSTHFEARRSGSEYVFDGRGFGHGVGMSQYGARGAARQGMSFQQILAHYFPGTSVSDPSGAALPNVATAGTPGPRSRTAPTPRTPVAGAESDPTPRYVEPTRRTRPTPRHQARAERENGTRRRAW